MQILMLLTWSKDKSSVKQVVAQDLGLKMLVTSINKVKQLSPIFDISGISARILTQIDRDICIWIIFLGSRQIGRNFVGDIWKYIPLN